MVKGKELDRNEAIMVGRRFREDMEDTLPEIALQHMKETIEYFYKEGFVIARKDETD